MANDWISTYISSPLKTTDVLLDSAACTGSARLMKTSANWSCCKSTPDNSLITYWRDGTMVIVAAERAYREIANCKLGDGSDSTPALGDGRIYIRSRKYLWCLGGK
ncbi:MAG: hypothetical protein WCT04_16565 [Planctomycetota bacterium]